MRKRSISTNWLNKLHKRAKQYEETAEKLEAEGLQITNEDRKIIKSYGKGYKNIESWLREKLTYDPKQGDERGVILMILELADILPTQEFPLASSFPDDLMAEISYSDSVFAKTSCDDPKLSEQLDKGLFLRIIENLTPFQAIVAIKRLVEGETYQEIASLMGCSRQYIQQEEKKLKAILFNDEKIRNLINKEGRRGFGDSLPESTQKPKKKRDNIWTDEQQSILYVLWFHHVSVKKIAEYFHRSSSTIFQHTASLGLHLNRGYSELDLTLSVSWSLTRLCHDCLFPLTFPSLSSRRFMKGTHLIYQHISDCPDPTRHQKLIRREIG